MPEVRIVDYEGLTVDAEARNVTVTVVDGGAGAQGEPGPQGDPGDPGPSAYEVAVANGFTGTEAEWLDSLQGVDGDDGESAYEVAVAAGFVGTAEEWLASLKGEPGEDGSDADATAAIEAHRVDTTDVHGIADTAALVTTSDPRLSDARTPTAHGHTSTDVSDFTEAVQDAVAALLAAGTAISLSYDDAGNSLTITGTGGGGGGLDAEAVRDAIGVALIGSGLISVTVNDEADTITISTTATANSTDAQLRDRSTHTGTQSADTLTDGTTNKAFLAAERTKLAGIATGATVNDTDANLKNRANHTGTQTSTTISDFTEATQDTVATMFSDVSEVTYNDTTGKLDIAFPPEGGGGGSSLMEPNVQTADYTLALSDAGKAVEINSATGVNVTVPPNSSVELPVGTVIGLYQAGTGAVTPVAGSGVTIRNLAPLSGQYAEASLRKRATNEWVLAGDIAGSAQPALKDYAQAVRTEGSVSLTATTMTAVHTALDLTIAASVGDLVEFGITGLLDVASSAANRVAKFDAYTIPSGSAANPFGPGLAPTQQGVPAWHFSNDATTMNRLGGTVTRVLTADDISGGLTTIRLYYKKDNTTARTLFALPTIPLTVWAKNYGPVA